MHALMNVLAWVSKHYGITDSSVSLNSDNHAYRVNSNYLLVRTVIDRIDFLY